MHEKHTHSRVYAFCRALEGLLRLLQCLSAAESAYASAMLAASKLVVPGDGEGELLKVCW